MPTIPPHITTRGAPPRHPVVEVDGTARLADRGPGFLDGLKRWGIVGKAASFILPAALALQLVGCSPAPAPTPDPSVTPVVVAVDGFEQPSGTVRPPAPAPVAPTPGPIDAAPVTVPPAPPPAPGPVQPAPAPVQPTPVVVAPAPGPVQPTPVVVAPAPVALTVSESVRAALADNVVTEAEVKALVVRVSAGASVDEYRALASAYASPALTPEARDVLDVAFARSGVPVGGGATRLTQVVERLAARDALGAPLRGRLNTTHLMKLDLAASADFPAGATVWSSPGARAQVFVDVPAAGVFGPFDTARPGS
jgi:hypothetical protein